MKVLILNSLYRPYDIGGAERSVEILAAGLKSAGMIPVIVSTADKDRVDTVDGVKSYYLKIPNFYWMRTAKAQPVYKKPFWHLLDSFNPFLKSKLSAVIENEKPDVFHSNNLGGFSVSAWKIAKSYKLPIVHTIRDHYLLCPNSVMYRNDRQCEKQCIRCRFYSLPKRGLSSRIDAVVGVSEFILKKHLRYGYFQNAAVKTHLYNPMSSDAAINSEDQDNEHIVFGYIGMLAPIKGIEYLLQRFSSIKPENAKLKIFGKGITPDYENYLKDKYTSGKIEFMGFTHPREIYGQIDMAVIPSLCDDAFPRVLIESYSHGVPVIATSLGGASELVEEGVTGTVFDPSKPGDLESKIDYYSNNRNAIAEMSENCRKAMVAFDLGTFTRRMIEIYQRVLEDREPNLSKRN
ncbi:MAG: glycosyltransferase family 4 protein [candidate division Zixibacteria bacterium]